MLQPMASLVLANIREIQGELKAIRGTNTILAVTYKALLSPVSKIWPSQSLLTGSTAVQTQSYPAPPARCVTLNHNLTSDGKHFLSFAVLRSYCNIALSGLVERLRVGPPTLTLLCWHKKSPRGVSDILGRLRTSLLRLSQKSNHI